MTQQKSSAVSPKKYVLKKQDTKAQYKIDYEKDLNPSQLEAVKTKEGSVLVIAGAGSGKTKTLTYRVARLIESGVKPEHILLLTFTKKAADEMLNRAVAILDSRCEKVAGGTFHSFSNYILRKYSNLLELRNNFTIIDRADAEDVVNHIRGQVIEKQEKRFPRKNTILDIYSKAINKNMTAEAVIESEYNQFSHAVEKINEISKQYMSYKRSNSLLDYDDLLLYLRTILQSNEEIRKQLSYQYKYIMIDEYQDTNSLQADIIRLLASEHNNVMAVGDDSQSIYSFRGANVTFVERRFKSLLVPYFGYNLFYLGVTVMIFHLTGKFWGMPISLKNFFITPFLNGHQFDLSCPLWFVTQLFMTMIAFLFVFRALRSVKDNRYFHLAVFTLIGVLAIPVSKIIHTDPFVLIIVRTMFSVFFVYLGYFYRHYIEDKINIFTMKWLGAVILLQSILWLFNRDFDPEHGIGLSYVLVWARFDHQLIVPVLTALTGIWVSLFVVKIAYPYVKDVKFVRLMDENTYHIMANHLLVMYIITAIFLYLNGIPIQQRANHDIYWIYNPAQTTYLYFVLTMVISTYIGVFLKFLKRKYLTFDKKEN